MSTRSYICVELPETKETGNILGIYCHSDGYLTYNGAILVDHYTDRDKVEKLMKLGHLSSLGEKVDPNPDYPHNFGRERQIGVCLAYSRDRGDNGQEAKVIPLTRLANDPWIRYIYMYTLDGQWKYIETKNYYAQRIEWKDVTEDLNQMFKNWEIKRPTNLYGFYDDEAIRILKAEQEKEKKEEA